jgi:putative peptide zinc metalloprotease protein
MEATQKNWPVLRQDLTLYKGPADPNGAPLWTLHDPARNQYFEIDWIAFEIISRLDLADPELICQQINSETTLYLTSQDVVNTIDFLTDNELVYRSSPQEVGQLLNTFERRRKSWFDRLLHGYLFFRVPIFRSDKPLEKLLPHMNFLYARRFYQLTFFIFLFGLWGVSTQWDAFTSTLVDTFSLDGLLGYASAVIVVKVLHELGHAITAKKCGCRVPTMGLAFLVMWPVAYTDVTESWKLDSHKKRLLIASAGIVTEALIAAWSIFLWSVLPEGAIKSLFFFLGTTSFAATIAINASPFMRFDGYFLLCDTVGMPNLHGRSFAYTRWWLREKLFNLKDSPPESLDNGQQKFFLIFALITWLYRLVVFFGIALLVYHYFFKALGIALFIVEMWFFILMPVVHEIKFWHRRWSEIGLGIRQKPAYYILVGLILFLMIPFDITVNAQGMFKPEKSLRVVATQAGQIIKMPPVIGTRVVEGTQLIGLSVPELEKKIKNLKARIDTLTQQYGAAGFDPKMVSQQPIYKEKLVSSQNELDGLIKEYEKLNRKATFSGIVIDVDPDLFLGEWVSKSSALVTIVDGDNWIVDCYVEEADLRRIDKGNWGRFVAEAPGVGAVGLTVLSIDRDATGVLNEGALSSLSGGEILVRPQNNKLIPERALYRVRLKVDSATSKLSTGYIRGQVVIFAWPKSILGDFVRGGLSTAIKELSF